jgi:hypothetical protein
VINDGGSYAPQMPWYMGHYCDWECGGVAGTLRSRKPSHLASCNDPPLQPESCVLMRSSGRHVAGSPRLLEKEHKWTRLIREHQI